MTEKGFYNSYKFLIYSGIAFFIAISILSKDDENHSNGFIILSLSLGFLLSFFQNKSKNKKHRKTLNILSIIIPITVLLYVIVRGFIS